MDGDVNTTNTVDDKAPGSQPRPPVDEPAGCSSCGKKDDKESKLGPRGMKRLGTEKSLNADVLDAGERVLKRIRNPDDALRMVPKVEPTGPHEMRVALAQRLVELHNQVAKELGPVVPPLEPVLQPRDGSPTNWASQPKVGGLEFDQLKSPQAIARAEAEMARLQAAAEKALGGSRGVKGGVEHWVDKSNVRNFRFDKDGKVTSWFDPVAVQPEWKEPKGSRPALVDRALREAQRATVPMPPIDDRVTVRPPPEVETVRPPVGPPTPNCDGCDKPPPKASDLEKTARAMFGAVYKGLDGFVYSVKDGMVVRMLATGALEAIPMHQLPDDVRNKLGYAAMKSAMRRMGRVAGADGVNNWTGWLASEEARRFLGVDGVELPGG